MSKYNNVKRGLVKPYVIIEGGSADPYSPLERGEGGQKSKKLPYVIYKRPLIGTGHLNYNLLKVSNILSC